MTPAFSSLVKQGLQTIGHYRRVLSHTTLPGVAVLCYHGVRDDSMPPGTIPFQYLHIPVSTLDSHCRVIRDCCDPISLDDWRASLCGGAPLPKRPVLMTFDDGYRSVLTKGVPILEKYGLPAAMFVCTGPMSTRRRLWFDEVAARDGEDAVEAWKARDHHDWAAACAGTAAMDECDPCALMTPGELGALAAVKGIEVGGHTVRHPILSRASHTEQRREVEQNLQSIQQWTGKPVRAFAYPNGRPGIDYTDETVAIVGESAVDMAFTTRALFARSDEQPLQRSRFILLDDTSDAELAHRLTYSWPR